jgi:phosphatidylserine/phosphatidylglycerophosphate/cardiolipin synthase-like enzyme
MRQRTEAGGLTVNAIAGSYVVVLGLDVTESARAGLRGFAIKREDTVEGETYWMKGTKTFESVEPHPAAGEQFSSLYQPFQTFQWADYSAKPGRTYVYTVVPMTGDPQALQQRTPVSVTVTTERTSGDHTIHFNRGAVATQEYARRFHNRPPSEVGKSAYAWLSRGLLEGIISFIRRARGAGYGLKGAFYEFQWPAVLEELRAAHARGVDVQIVFDDIDTAGGPHAANEDAIGKAQIAALCKPRTHGTLMHNKFLVLTHGTPKAVLFGSTNLTENGIFGHANCTHVVENQTIAGNYLGLFEKLTSDPATTHESGYKKWTVEHTPAPAESFEAGMASVFSPRSNLEALNWYATLAGQATQGLFMTFAFGMNAQFQQVYGRPDGVLRVGLMEKEWSGANKQRQLDAIRRLQALPNVVIAIGNRIPLTGFDRWLGELERISDHVNVHWIHLKFMLVDPLSDHPTVVTGSANFSDASTTTNDENMLVIKGNTRVADIYLGEFMRLYSHYAFRQAVKIFLDTHPHASAADMRQGFLIEHGDWTSSYFDPHDRSGRMARRRYFAQSEQSAAITI